MPHTIKVENNEVTICTDVYIMSLIIGLAREHVEHLVTEGRYGDDDLHLAAVDVLNDLANVVGIIEP